VHAIGVETPPIASGDLVRTSPYQHTKRVAI
jgi:hypothetical protein